MPGRKDIRALRRLAPKLRPPCEECAERAGGGCPYLRSDDCPQLENYFLATLPSAESITGDEARRISRRAMHRARRDPCSIGVAVEDALLDKVDASREVVNSDGAIPEPSDEIFVQAVFDELLRGKLTFQAIADKLYGTAEGVRAIAEALIAETDDVIVRAIIRDRLTGAEAARQFKKLPPHVSRCLRRFRGKVSVNFFRICRTPSRRGGAVSMKRLDITLNFEENLVHDLDLVATRLGRSREDVLTGIVCRWFAERDLNRGTGEQLYEFQPGLTALELYSEIFRHLENERRRRDGRDLEAIAMQNATVIATAQTFEALVAAGSLPEGLPSTIDRELILTLWSRLRRGEITQAAFDAELDYQRRFPCGELEDGD